MPLGRPKERSRAILGTSQGRAGVPGTSLQERPWGVPGCPGDVPQKLGCRTTKSKILDGIVIFGTRNKKRPFWRLNLSQLVTSKKVSF